MRMHCTLVIGGTLLPAQAETLATALVARRPYNLRGPLTTEGALQRMAEERAPVFEFEGVEDGTLFPEIAELLDACRLDRCWYAVGDGDDEDLVHLYSGDGRHASHHFLPATHDLALRVRDADSHALEEALSWQRWIDALRLDLVPSAHVAMENHAAQNADRPLTTAPSA